LGDKCAHPVLLRMENDIYYARLILEASNEIMERKIVELDARPSDCIALAVRNGAPLYVVRALWERLEDVSETLEQMRREGQEGQEGQ